jgi:hypothetical protein
MATSTLPPSPVADSTPAQAGASTIQPVGKLGAGRAFGVMLGGPVVLLGAVARAVARTLHGVREGRPPAPADAATLAATVAYAAVALPLMRRWGATDAEIAAPLPGDETVAAGGIRQTHAITIDAPADEVWPWVAQIGQDRGGFYSYAWLENLAGCRMHNAERIHPEWQSRAVGDTVLLHPGSGLKVVRWEPGRALVLEGGWSLHVAPHGPRRCRLIARFRAPRGLAGSGYALALELPHFLMERRMLLTIKRRAEHR